jgi:hypothetical protein
MISERRCASVASSPRPSAGRVFGRDSTAFWIDGRDGRVSFGVDLTRVLSLVFDEEMEKVMTAILCCSTSNVESNSEIRKRKAVGVSR